MGNGLSPEIDKMLRQWRDANPAVSWPDPMLPPWDQYPDIPPLSIGWRMGSGEDYRIAFHDWLRGLESKARDQFIKENPEPEGWAGFFDQLTS